MANKHGRPATLPDKTSKKRADKREKLAEADREYQRVRKALATLN